VAGGVAWRATGLVAKREALVKDKTLVQRKLKILDCQQRAIQVDVDARAAALTAATAKSRQQGEATLTGTRKRAAKRS